MASEEAAHMSDRSEVAVITGAGSGIGKACALRFAGDGVRVVISDIDSDALRTVSRQITGQGGQCLCVTADVADFGACERTAQQALATWGRIDMLVANAGVQIGGSLLEASEHDWDTILAVNLKGVAYSCKASMPTVESMGEWNTRRAFFIPEIEASSFWPSISSRNCFLIVNGRPARSTSAWPCLSISSLDDWKL